MKEKIGIEKLLSLLNEYDNGWDYDDYYGPYQYGQDRDAYHLCKYQLVSKEYGFIKWLVDNDKIDKRKIDTRLVKNVESHYDEEGYWVENSYEDYSDIDTLLMLLSISDTPIEDLISYLK